MTEKTLANGSRVTFSVHGRYGTHTYEGTLVENPPVTGRVTCKTDDEHEYRPWISQVRAV